MKYVKFLRALKEKSEKLMSAKLTKFQLVKVHLSPEF